MAIWKEQTSPRKEATPVPQDTSPRREEERPAAPSYSSSVSSHDLPARVKERESKESLIASDLTIEGKIEGSGHVRLAGRFKGDVSVDGDLTIDPGAKVTGGVRARAVIIGGELEGNIEGAQRVELLETGVLNGDLKAGSLTVAAGSRMRGQVAFGWEAEQQPESRIKMVTDSAP
ncbi:MAG: polymer-forming cytoskeletal protein [Anaerolineae bacterium]|nr:polymer-forming cytoskeletal protein [Gemmatimonadaceae bacterium]